LTMRDKTASTISTTESLIKKLTPILTSKPFNPLRPFTNNHAQTLLGYFYPRRYKLRSHLQDKSHLFAIEKDIRLLAHCRWQKDKTNSPTIVLIHGLEGSTASVYMISTAAKAFRAGFNVVRLNMRTCGGTEHLATTVYHSGMYADFLAVINQLIEQDKLNHIYLVGFSMSANMVLHLAGRLRESLPDELKAVCAISPAVDVTASMVELHKRSNKIYHDRFLRSLLTRMRKKYELFPDLYDLSNIHKIKTINDFDEEYTAHHAGYENAGAYYKGVSSFPVLNQIEKPTLIIHAQDDPFIPFAPLLDDSVKNNPNILLLEPERGGHVGFVGSKNGTDYDRFWMEHRIVEFCKLIAGNTGIPVCNERESAKKNSPESNRKV